MESIASPRLQSPPATSNRVPELGRIKAASERIGKATYQIAAFLERFNGPAPDTAENTPERSEGYRNDISELFDTIDRLEQRVNALNEIG